MLDQYARRPKVLCTGQTEPDCGSMQSIITGCTCCRASAYRWHHRDSIHQGSRPDSTRGTRACLNRGDGAIRIMSATRADLGGHPSIACLPACLAKGTNQDSSTAVCTSGVSCTTTGVGRRAFSSSLQNLLALH